MLCRHAHLVGILKTEEKCWNRPDAPLRSRMKIHLCGRVDGAVCPERRCRVFGHDSCRRTTRPLDGMSKAMGEEVERSIHPYPLEVTKFVGVDGLASINAPTYRVQDGLKTINEGVLSRDVPSVVLHQLNHLCDDTLEDASARCLDALVQSGQDAVDEGLDELHRVLLIVEVSIGQCRSKCLGLENRTHGTFDNGLDDVMSKTLLIHRLGLGCRGHGEGHEAIGGVTGILGIDALQKSSKLRRHGVDLRGDTRKIRSIVQDPGCHETDHLLHQCPLSHRTVEMLDRDSHVWILLLEDADPSEFHASVQVPVSFLEEGIS